MFAQTFTRKYRERMKYVHAFDINRHPPAKRTKCQRHYCELPILVYFSFVLKLKIAKAKQSREVGSRLVMLAMISTSSRLAHVLKQNIRSFPRIPRRILFLENHKALPHEEFLNLLASNNISRFLWKNNFYINKLKSNIHSLKHWYNFAINESSQLPREREKWDNFPLTNKAQMKWSYLSYRT